MDRGAHLIIGGVVAFLIAYAINGFSLGPFLAGAIFGSIIGSLAPDIIEPAGHYTHRDFFHSKRILKYLVIPLLISFPIMFFVPVFDWVFFSLIGYEMHLLADSTTPMGLPD
jgi:membrane-bound metal-dependent hydrolase YbcI (DUF457 family)